MSIREKIRRLLRCRREVRSMTPKEIAKAFEKGCFTEREELEALQLTIERERKRQGLTKDGRRRDSSIPTLEDSSSDS